MTHLEWKQVKHQGNLPISSPDGLWHPLKAAGLHEKAPGLALRAPDWALTFHQCSELQTIASSCWVSRGRNFLATGPLHVLFLCMQHPLPSSPSIF